MEPDVKACLGRLALLFWEAAPQPPGGRIVLARQLLKCATRRGARFTEKRTRIASVSHKLCSIPRALKDLVSLKSLLFFFFLIVLLKKKKIP